MTKKKLTKNPVNSDLREAMEWLSRLAAPGGYHNTYPRTVAAEIMRLRKERDASRSVLVDLLRLIFGEAFERKLRPPKGRKR